MKDYNPYCTAVLFVAVTMCSCQKNISDSALRTATDSSFLPKQIIITDTTAPPATRIKQCYSLKYAADHQRVDLYLDDTTNANPYDVFSNAYILNKDGYLISWVQQEAGGLVILRLKFIFRQRFLFAGYPGFSFYRRPAG